MKRRSMKSQGRRKRTGRGYAEKFRLKNNGHSRDPRWMWWTEDKADTRPAMPGLEPAAASVEG